MVSIMITLLGIGVALFISKEQSLSAESQMLQQGWVILGVEMPTHRPTPSLHGRLQTLTSIVGKPKLTTN